ncbi:MAG: hypothetical protein HGB14_05360 [Anaerolineaceae bacterium]|nr:hypothetical protein [Anaerolineaceae bacterium]
MNAPNYVLLGDVEGVSIDFYNCNYADYDVVLFMGYDARIAEARAAKPSIKIGVIDVRPGSLDSVMGADFIVANGVEMQDWLSDYFANIFIYPIYPLIKNPPEKVHTLHEPLIIGYHGNKVHLTTTLPYISTALEEIAKFHPLEFWAIYNMKKHGEMSFNLFNSSKIKVRYIQWAEDVYEKILSQADVGIVPSLIPIQEPQFAKNRISHLSSPFYPHPSDILLRFKCTTNPGRIYVFSQLCIPVVAGYSLSASQVIHHGVNGFLAHSAGGWYRALKSLADAGEFDPVKIEQAIVKYGIDPDATAPWLI